MEYGIYNAYCISLLLLPTFFISAISNSLLPEISKFYSMNNKIMIKKRIKQSILLCLFIGIISILFIYFFKYNILSILYNTNKGINYINYLCYFFILYYFEAPLGSVLIGMGYIKVSTIISVIGIFIKTISLIVFILLKCGLYSLIIAECLDIIFIVISEFIIIKKLLK